MTEGGGAGKHGGKRKEVSSGGFQSLGLSDPVYRGIVRMGFRVRRIDCYIIYIYTPSNCSFI
jgi:hypothetical protein